MWGPSQKYRTLWIELYFTSYNFKTSLPEHLSAESVDKQLELEAEPRENKLKMATIINRTMLQQGLATDVIPFL